MTALYGKKNSSAERGVALIMALLVLLLLTAVGMGMILMSNTETNISANFRDEQTAYFAAKAGIEEVRDRLRAGATNSVNLPATLGNNTPGGATGPGVLYVTNPLNSETVSPWVTTGTHYPDDQIGKELNCLTSTPPSGTWWTTPQSASTSYAASPILQWKWVRVMAKLNKSDTTCVNVTSADGAINNNRVCWNGNNEVSTAAASCSAANATYYPVYELTSLAVTSGGSRRMMQYEVSQNSFPTIPGAFVFDGSGPNFNPPNSTPFAVSGTDPLTHSGTSVTAPFGSINGVSCPLPASQPALGAYDNSSVTTLNSDISKRASDYTTSTPAVAVFNVNPALGMNSINLTTVDGLTKMVNLITTAAGPNVYANGVTPANLGTATSPVVNVVNGDLKIGGSGAGILLVTGQLTLDGAFSWDGLILVIGEGAIVKSGGGSATVNGAMFEANLFSDASAGTSGPGPYPGYSNPIALGSNNPPGIPFFNWSGGGNATVQYDSCWINAVTGSLPYHLITQRELSF
jgi:hypothetical protein